MIAPPGLAGVVVADTTVGDLRGEDGFFHYRQHDAVELAARRSYEDVCALLLDGALPRDGSFSAELRSARGVDVDPPVVGSPAAAVRTAVSLLGAAEGMLPVVDLDVAARRRDCVRLIAALPTLVGAVHRRSPVVGRDDLGHGANLLWLLTGEEPDPGVAAALERYLVIALDHGFNTSTFAARVIVSSGADVASAVVGAIGALSGPRHGGAPSRVLDLLDRVSDDDPAGELERLVAGGARVPGFGHRIYRSEDPRATFLRGVASSAGARRYDAALAVERAATELLAPKGLSVNVELWAAVVLDHCGIPRELFTPVFACSRVAGWCANLLEQASDPRVIRPSARYVGPPPPEPVPEV